MECEMCYETITPASNRRTEARWVVRKAKNKWNPAKTDKEWLPVCGNCQNDRWKSMVKSLDMEDIKHRRVGTAAAVNNPWHEEWKHRLYKQLQHGDIACGRIKEGEEEPEFRLCRKIISSEIVGPQSKRDRATGWVDLEEELL